MIYEDRIILFLDILGFQKIIEDTIHKGEEIPEKTEQLHKILLLMQSEVGKINKGNTTFVTQFSDTIIVSFKDNDKEEIINFFNVIIRLIIKLTFKGILCRGAISYGKLFHNNDFIFGPALNDAYLTESSAALYPRVILDGVTRDILKSQLQKHDKWTNKDILNIPGILNIDTDDKYYFDYFSGTLIIFRNNDTLLIEYFKSLRKTIVALNRFSSPSIKVKYGWLKNKFNKFKEQELPIIEAEFEVFSPAYGFIKKKIDLI